MPPEPPTPADRDFALYQRARDPEALGRVFDATAGKLLLVAMHLVRDAAAAEDVLQATFLAAMRNCEQYDPGRPVLPWLTGILGNQATILWRERSRQPDPARLAAAPVPDPAQLAERAESAAAVAAALDGMPSPYRQVLVLALVHGLRAVEVARALERPPETVRSQLHRGLELLRRALPRGLAVPALALAAGGLAGRGLAAVRAAVQAEALAQVAPVVAAAANAAPAVVAQATPAVGGFAVCFGGILLMQKALLGVIGALVVALLLWCLSTGSGPSGHAAAARPDNPAAAQAPSDEKGTKADAQPAASEQRVAVADEPAGPRLLVRVVDAHTGRPEAAAEVLSVLDLDASALPAAERAAFVASESQDAEAHARRFGRLWRTDGDGTVAVPWPRGWRAVFVARAGIRYGQAQFTQDGSPELRIALEDDVTLRVRVVGPDATPVAQVAVALAVRWPDSESPAGIRLGITDREGLVCRRHLQVALWELQRLRRVPPIAVRVVSDIPAVDHPGVPIDLAALPSAPIVLAIPPTGRIAVGLVDERGVTAGACPWANLRELRAGSAWASASLDTEGDDDRLVFPHVGLGARFAVTSTPFPQQEGPGPTQPGEEVAFRFRSDATAPSLNGRALAADGEPMRSQILDLWIVRADGPQSQRVRTDADGRFCCLLTAKGRERPPASCAQLELLQHGSRTGLMARVDLQPADGPLQLGDVVLREGPLLAAGTMLDSEGLFVTPQLELRALEADAATGPVLAPPPSVVRGPGDRFSIRGFTAAPRLELLATGREYLACEPLRFDRGASDLRLVLRRKGRIVVTVLHDLPFELANLLCTEVIADGETGAQRPSWSAGPASPGQMRINLEDLAAGRCTLQVRIAGDPKPLAAIADIDVACGAVRDPRLTAIDIRGRVRIVRVQVLDGDGAPVLGPDSLLQAGTLVVDDASSGIRWVQLRDGWFLVPVASRPVAATIRVPGYRDQRVEAIDGDRTVRLEPLLELRARLQPELALPPGVTLHAFARVRGEPASPFDEVMRRQRGPIAGSGKPPAAQTGQRFTFALANTGDCELTFVLARNGGTRSVALPATPAMVAIAGSGAAKEVTCTAADADLQAALRDLLGN